MSGRKIYIRDVPRDDRPQCEVKGCWSKVDKDLSVTKCFEHQMDQNIREDLASRKKKEAELVPAVLQ